MMPNSGPQHGQPHPRFAQPEDGHPGRGSLGLTRLDLPRLGRQQPTGNGAAGRPPSGGWRRISWQYAVGAIALTSVVAVGIGYAASRTQSAQPGAQSGSAPTGSADAALSPGTGAAASGKTGAPKKPAGNVPLGGASHAGPLELSASGAQLAAWDHTSSQCAQASWELPNGTVATDSSGNVELTVPGETGSCGALVSPQTYSSGVIEADIDFPALPGHPNVIANWTSFWMTNSAHWPTYGELDAAEAEPIDGVTDVTWHSGSAANLFSASTEFASTRLPRYSKNLTPGWHTVDIVYTQGYFAIYYDGTEFTSYTSANVPGDPLNILFSTSVAPNNTAVDNEIGGTPVNSDSSPATYKLKYVKVWSFK